MKKRILAICLAVVIITAFVAVPKMASAYVYDVYFNGVNEYGCHTVWRVRYNVDYWNQVTTESRTLMSTTCE